MKKCFAFCLALLTLLPFIIGCQKDPSSNPTGTNDNTAAETDPFDDEVPDGLKFDGRVFTICCPGPEDWGVQSYDREELNSDSVNDAIYTRNRELERRFDIKIDTLTLGSTDSVPSDFASFALSDEDYIDMLAVGYYQSGKPLIMNGYIVPWNDVPYIKPEKSWWNSNINETLSILGNTYLIVGDVNWFTMPEVPVCYFNKTVAADNAEKVGDLYKTVKDKEWTFDKCYSIAKEITKDLNGDGIYDENDRYGCIQNTIIGVTGFVYAANYNTVVVTEEGPQMQFNTDKMVDIIQYLYDLCCTNNISYVETFDFIEDSKGIPIFFANRALFYFDVLLFSETFRKEENDFGIIPYPKFDEVQEEYASYANQWGLACGLPCTATNYERTGAILEAMCALSSKLIKPAYYDKALVGRNIRDDESAEMLDIIFSNIIYDFGISFCTDLAYIPSKTFVERKTTNVASWYKANQKRIEQNYNELFEYVEEELGART